jgi:hypothetical protein
MLSFKRWGEMSHSIEDERIPGFCPICSKPVDVMVAESSVELFGVCCECGGMLFYSDKTPLYVGERICRDDEVE